ncbi:MAG: arginine--tRNA ligase [Endomicrobiia bacterium]
MIKKVRKIFDEILKSFCWEVEFELKEPPKEIKFDFATNLPLSVARKYKVSSQKVFENIKNELLKKFKEIFIEIKFSEPGFLNFNLSLNFYFDEIQEIFRNKERYLKSNSENVVGKKLLIEFVSANPTGPLHIGHGRCAVLGDVLGNIFKKLGYDLTKEYYVNDRGRQIDVLVASVIDSVLKIGDMYVEEEIKTWTEEIVKETKYKGEYIRDVAKKLKEKFFEISDRNIDSVKKFVVETMMEDIKSSLENFKVKFDNYFYETSLYNSGETDRIKEILLKKISSKEESLVEYKDGALWFKSHKFSEDDKDRVLIKSNGEPTYFFSDIAYHYNKISRGYNWLINIWGTDHHGYVERLKSSCKTIFEFLGMNYKLDIILYQLVSLIKNGNKIAMSTREGKFISLDEVVKEVGCDVTRFFLLTKSPNAHLEFDFNLAKEHSLKNPVYYIQYAHTRCCGILKEIKQLPGNDQLINSVKESCEILKQEEIELIKKLCLYSEILQVCIETFSPHHLCNYLIDLARIFHKFYENCRVINNSEVIYYRLFLVMITKIVLSDALEILGVEAPQKM